MALKKIYSDLQYGFRKLSSGDMAALYDEASVNQSLRTLFNTKQGERLFQPSYGTRIPFLLFEPFDQSTANRLVQEIQEAIRNWESIRVDLTDLKLNMDWDNGIYYVDLTYKIKSTVDVGSLQLEFNKQ